MSRSGADYANDHLGNLSPALSVPAVPASGAVVHNATGGMQIIQFEALGGASAGTVAIALGPANAPAAVGQPITVAISAEVMLPLLIVPAGWYFSLTTGGAAAPTLQAVYQIQL